MVARIERDRHDAGVPVSRVVAAAAAVFAVGALVAREARADEPPSSTPAPEAAAGEGGDATTESSPASWRSVVLRVGTIGAYRGLFDLRILGGGLAVSIGGESQTIGGHANMYLLKAQSAAGLQVVEWGLSGTAEWRVDNVRLGLGGGWTYFGVQRATDGSFLQSFGPMALLRAGYDFGERSGLYVLGDCQVQLQAGAAVVWGPTVQLGYRF
jgi:hypothetical protein